MKGNRQISAKVYCSCYRNHDRVRIFCSAYDDVASVGQNFDSPLTRREFMKRHCYPPSDQCRCCLYPILFRESCGDDS